MKRELLFHFLLEDVQIKELIGHEIITIVRGKEVNKGKVIDVSGDRILIKFKYETGGSNALNKSPGAVWYPKSMAKSILWNPNRKLFIFKIS